MPDKDGNPTKAELAQAAAEAREMARLVIENAASGGNETARKMAKGVAKDRRKEQRHEKEQRRKK